MDKPAVVTVECWGSSCRIEGPPGVFHQIDVLTNHSDGLHQYRTAISCKYWNRKVGIPVVRELAQVVQDAGLSKGVVVSKMGFTDPARTYAESKSIGLVELRKPVDKDWDGYIREIHINLEMDTTRIHDINFEITVPKPDPGQKPLQSGFVFCPLTLNQVFIGIPGKEIETLQQLASEERRRHPDKDKYELCFPAGSVVTIPDHPEHPTHGHSVTGVSFRVEYNPPVTRDIVVRADDHIYMIMESLFDGRRFNITKDGEIRETRGSQ